MLYMFVWTGYTGSYGWFLTFQKPVNFQLGQPHFSTYLNIAIFISLAFSFSIPISHSRSLQCLFSMYMNEIISMLRKNCCKCVYINEDAPNVMSLVYADTLEQFWNQWGLVNMSKTRKVVFRTGSALKHFEKWYFKGAKIEIVHYKYLRIIFSSQLQALNYQAEKALHKLRKLHYICVFLTIELSLGGHHPICRGGGGLEFLSRANYLFQPGSAARWKFHILLHVFIEQFLK